MGDRRFKVAPGFTHFLPLTSNLWSLPIWILLSLIANCFLLSLLLITLRDGNVPVASPNLAVAASSTTIATPANLAVVSPAASELGPRHQLTYRQWVSLLKQEAKAAAEQKPQHLNVLVGDSISLWFPYDLLPSDRNWLNQGISGETSAGLLKRLDLFDATDPDTIFVMIGINDLIRGVSDADILDNQTEIIQQLKASHPRSQIVVQSILPHADSRVTWEGRERLKQVPNRKIRQLNQALQTIATEEEVYYLDLYPLFADEDGNLQMILSTDGLHLNPQGYLVWRTALQLYSQVKLDKQK